MPRNIPAELNTFANSNVKTSAMCVLVTRTDGVILGFTTSTSPLIIGGVTYNTNGSVDSSNLKTSASSGVDNLEFLGLLDSELITEDDIIAGRYDNARLLFFMCDYTDPGAGQIILASGWFGEVTLNDGNYKAELRGLTQNLKENITYLTTPTCRCRQLGDTQCKVNLAPFTFNNSVAAIESDQRTITIDGDANITTFYDNGLITFTSGLNTGLTREVKQSTNIAANTMQIILRQYFPFNIADGDQFTIIAGCDRTFPTCDTKFANTLNFHGEAFLPGNAQIMLVGRGYPINADNYDGGDIETE